MKNSKLRRILLLLACAVLLVSLSVGATLAYLTSTDEVENTFTVGDVQIKLDEAKVDTETGKAVEPEERIDDGNKLVRMVPGRLIDKDPTVTVLANSENCYVRAKVTVDVSESWKRPTDGSTDTFEAWAIDFDKNFIRYENESPERSGFNLTNWTVGGLMINSDVRTVEYILIYKNDATNNIVAKNEADDTKLPAIFTHVQVPTNLDNDALAKLAGMKINVVAEAIQAEGFENQKKAWEAFDSQEAN